MSNIENDIHGEGFDHENASKDHDNTLENRADTLEDHDAGRKDPDTASKDNDNTPNIHDSAPQNNNNSNSNSNSNSNNNNNNNVFGRKKTDSEKPLVQMGLSGIESRRDGEDGDKEDADAENARVFEMHQKRLQHQHPLPHVLSVSLPRRSVSSAFGISAVSRKPPSIAPSSVSHLRYHAVISSARYSTARRSCTPSIGGQVNRPMTEGEVVAVEQMMESEERRLAALARVAEEDERRLKLLIDSEVVREAASLNRILSIEEEKKKRIQASRQNSALRAETARIKRLYIEEEKRRKYEKLWKEREQRHKYYDPYMMFTARHLAKQQRQANESL